MPTAGSRLLGAALEPPARSSPSRAASAVVLPGVQRHPDRPLPQFLRVLLLRVLPRCHHRCSSRLDGLHQTRPSSLSQRHCPGAPHPPTGRRPGDAAVSSAITTGRVLTGGADCRRLRAASLALNGLRSWATTGRCAAERAVIPAAELTVEQARAL